jgi:hypothetical protein
VLTLPHISARLDRLLKRQEPWRCPAAIKVDYGRRKKNDRPEHARQPAHDGPKMVRHGQRVAQRGWAQRRAPELQRRPDEPGLGPCARRTAGVSRRDSK